jgi:malonate-semialdehyde dehydrogenase (acetylating)/methylmalonate-semialdehyde dehydrogenase
VPTPRACRPGRPPSTTPATGGQQAQVLLAERADVDAAVAAARTAFESWKEVSVVRRSRIMFAFRNLVEQHLDDLARIVASEHGKVVEDAKGEVIRGMEVAEFACGIPQLLKGEYSDQVSGGVDSFSFRQPLGVCAGITPFNFPVMVPMWMHPMAIATGNTFVLKPSSATRAPRTSSPSCTPRPGCRTASSTSSTATRSRSTRSSSTPTSTR